jgi:ComF family protein
MANHFSPIKSFSGMLVDLVVPAQCLICEALCEQPGGCCGSCWRKIRFISRPFCEITGAPFSTAMGDGVVSASAISDPPPYERCRSAVIYDENIKSLVIGLKYSDRSDLAPWMAKWMVTAGQELFADKPMVVPVPLHRFRLFQRRFNQAAELARYICNSTGLEFRPVILQRSRKTNQQVGLSGQQRERNVRGAFRVPPNKKMELTGRRVLLIDDVYTSGATVKAATRALIRAGAYAVDVLTFARVESPGQDYQGL